MGITQDTSSSYSQNNKRIAKNTLLLYFRTIIILLITLYTSRVVLNVLGVEDYGIYNVVGGVVAMFSLVSGSLSSSISRFITFELGRGDGERLATVFSTSVNIQLSLSFLILLLGGTIGGWFLNTQMNIPAERLSAANWVLYCSLLVFCINLISIPYNASIVAHERMSVFAYVSILDAALRLSICFLIMASPFDKLKSYAVLLVIVALIIRLVYGAYCSRHFAECHYRRVFDRSLLGQMGGLAGWTLATNGCWMFGTQGVNILINLFFGVTLNAARGIATQVDGAIQQFVNNFTMAINPQITKSYASGHIPEMFVLVCRGAKFSYFLLLLFALPVMLEADYVLRLWLKTVPEYAVPFLRLSIVGSILVVLGNTGLTACMAAGDMKRYTFWVSGVAGLVFPLTWVAFRSGLPPESTYWIFIGVYAGVDIVRLYVMKGLLGFSPRMFVRDVVLRIVLVTLLALPFPCLVQFLIRDASFGRLVLTVLVCLLSSGISIYCAGLSRGERKAVTGKMQLYVLKLRKNKFR